MKLQWKPKKSTEAPFVVDVPDAFTQAFVIEKDSKRFPESGGWGYALFNYEAASDTLRPIPAPQIADTRAMWPLRRRTTSSIHTRSVEHRVPTDLAALRAKEMSAFGAKWTSKKSAKAQGRRK